MKKLHFLFIILFLAALFIGCSKDDNQAIDNGETPTIDNGDDITLSMKLQVPVTSIPGTYALSQADENKLAQLDILVFKNNGASETFLYKTHATDINDNSGQAAKEFKANLQKSVGVAQHRIVILANMRTAIDAVAGTFNDTMTKEEVLAAISFSSNTKWNTTNSANFTPLPMWGESNGTHVITASTNAVSIGTIRMMRSIARIDVGINMDVNEVPQGLGNLLKISEVKVYNSNNKGAAAPLEANLVSNKAALPTIPAGAAVNTPALAYEHTTPDFGFVREIYISEVDNKTLADDDKVACIVLSGYYTAPGDPINTTKKTWYRIDFYDRNGAPTDRLDILRNTRYRMNITNIGGAGYDTEAEAFNSRPLNLDVDIEAWDEAQMNDITFDGQYQLVVNKNEMAFFKEGRMQEISIYTDHPDGWEILPTDMPNWISITPNSDNSSAKIDVQVTATANAGGARSEYMIIRAGKMLKKVKISQNDEPELTLELSTDLIIFRKSGSLAKAVTVTTHPAGAIRFTTTGGDVVWAAGYAPTDLDGTNLTSFSLKPTVNTLSQTLNSVVTVYIQEGNKMVFKTITVKQLATDLLFQITNKPVTYPAAGGANFFSVESEAPYQFSTDGVLDPLNMLSGFATAEQSVALSPTPFNFILTPNPSYHQNRTTKFKVTSSDVDFPIQNVDIAQTFVGPYLKLNGLEANIVVDFGTATTNEERSVTINSNAGWSSNTPANWAEVISSWIPGLGGTTSGSTIPTQGQDHVLKIRTTNNVVGMPVAGQEVSKIFTITTANHGAAPAVARTVTVKRRIQGVWAYASANPANGAAIAHDGQNVNIYANTNMKWWVGSNAATLVSQGAGPYALNKALTIAIPKNATWTNPRSVTVSAIQDGEPLVNRATYTQPGWTLGTSGNNVPNPIPPNAANYVVTTTTATSAPNFRMTTALGYNSENWLWLSVPEGIGNRGVHIPAQPLNAAGWTSSRQISIRMEESGNRWVSVLNYPQSPYDLSAHPSHIDIPNPTAAEGRTYNVYMITNTSAPDFRIGAWINGGADGIIESGWENVGWRSLAIPENTTPVARNITVKYEKQGYQWVDIITVQQLPGPYQVNPSLLLHKTLTTGTYDQSFTFCNNLTPTGTWRVPTRAEGTTIRLWNISKGNILAATIQEYDWTSTNYNISQAYVYAPLNNPQGLDRFWNKSDPAPGIRCVKSI